MKKAGSPIKRLKCSFLRVIVAVFWVLKNLVFFFSNVVYLDRRTQSTPWIFPNIKASEG